MYHVHVQKQSFLQNCLVGGLLAVRGNEQHEADMEQNGIENIDLVVMNLSPFEHTVSTGAKFEECVENIGIGGPAMLRSAAKNHSSVVAVSIHQSG